MRVQDVVSFSKESFFNGAVQTEWFYDPEKVGPIAESYVFHGPKYYGVSDGDVKTGSHKLIDTTSFAKNITAKLYAEHPDNSFVMTISGYGSGKSHLAVCLGALFSRIPGIERTVTENIIKTDAEAGAYIRSVNTKQNLVIVLNGMNNFNLDAEILRCARLSLAQHGVSDDLFRKLTKSYDIARHFVERTFDNYCRQFEDAAEKHNINLMGNSLKMYLQGNVESSSQALSTINDVYKEINGDSIAWDRGLSAGDILLTLQEELCGEGKPFNKILLLFDEFGRYIEYTAANPAIAGEAALQQIFEAAQTANGNIIFVGFIQSELDAYLARIKKTSNITRYLERYRTASENLFLSSNFETILANIIKKRENFDKTVGNSLERYANFLSGIRTSLLRWDRSSVKKGVWTSENMYQNVILSGCYPLHPITVWLLSGSHQWMQQRSTLAFASEMYDSISSESVDSRFPPYVFPYQIVDSGIYNEMLNSEEKGLISSQFCMLYRDIIAKVGNKLSEQELTTLKGVLVINMGRLAFFDKEDAIHAICLCTNLQDEEVRRALANLEEMYGIVAFDNHSKTYDLIAEANGFNEFKRIFSRHRLGIQADLMDIDDQLKKELTLDTVRDTSFALDKHISSTEWGFSKVFIESKYINETLLNSAIHDASDNCTGENPRGTLFFAYCAESSSMEVSRLTKLYNELRIKEYPIIILFLDDSEKEIISALCAKKALYKFSASDRDRFRKHFLDTQRSQNNRICRRFTQCVHQNVMIGETGLVPYTERLNLLCTKKLQEIYFKAVPFVFDGFENKSKSQAKSSLIMLCCSLYNRTLTNQQVYNSLSPKDKNRAASCLSTQAPYSWKVFNNNCQLVGAQNPTIKEIIDQVILELQDGKQHSAFNVFYKYARAPYGMNENSLALLIAYFSAFEGNNYHFYYGNERLAPQHWGGDKGKLKIPEIRKIFIQFNPSADINLIEVMCKKIMGNTDVDICEQLGEQLSDLIVQEGDNDENKYLVAQATTYLEHGIRLHKKISELYQNLRKLTDDQEKRFNPLAFVKIFNMLPDMDDVIEPDLPYVYSEYYKKNIIQLGIKLQSLLKTRYIPSLDKITCQITELSQCKRSCKLAADILRKNNCDFYADATDKRMHEIETTVLAQQKYEKSLAECEKDIVQSLGATTYQQCETALLKLQGWEKFLQESDLPASILVGVQNRLSESVQKIEDTRENLAEKFTAITSKIDHVESASELKKISADIKHLEQLEFDQRQQEQLSQIQDEIQDVLTVMMMVPSNLDEMFEFLDSSMEKVKDRYRRALNQFITSKIEETEKKQNSWMERYIEQAALSVEEMSEVECQRWLKITSEIPAYFSTSVLNYISTVRTQVESQLHKNRVAGLLAAYDNLTSEEKRQFKQLLDNR